MSDGVHLLTGHQETNHITAIDESTATAAFFSNENSVITDDDSVDAIPLTVNTTTGAVTIGSFVALFCGRKVTVDTASATYTRPASSSLYRRVSLGILYAKDTDNDDVEDCTFVAYTSATDTTEADAADDDTGAPTVTTIGSSTTTAYMELFDLVVSSDTVKRKSKTYNRTQTLAEVVDMADVARVVKAEESAIGTETYDTSYKTFTFGKNIVEILNGARFAVLKMAAEDTTNVNTPPLYAFYSGEFYGTLSSTRLAFTAPAFVSKDGNQVCMAYKMMWGGTLPNNIIKVSRVNDDSFAPSAQPWRYISIYVWR